ncbi:MAG: hypothetical protein AAF799_12715 [Myxococcota bacterium]
MSIARSLSPLPITLSLILAPTGCDPPEPDFEEQQQFQSNRTTTGHSENFCLRWQGETIRIYPMGFGTAIRSAEVEIEDSHVELVVHDEQYENPTSENDWLLAYDWTVSCDYVGGRLDVRLQNDSSKEWMIVDSESRIGSTSNANSPYTHFTMQPRPGGQDLYSLAGWSRTTNGQWDPVTAYPIGGPLRRGDLHARSPGAGCGTTYAVRLAPPAPSME